MTSKTAVLVPRDATEEMLAAFHSVVRIQCDPLNQTASILNDAEVWSALLKAAPEDAGDMLAALKAALGYLLNAAIDLETGAPKRTALNTINGGVALVRAAISKAEGSAS